MIEIEHKKNELERELWRFTMFELNIVLDGYYSQKKTSNRKKNWETIARYDRLGERESDILEANVPLPDNIMFRASEYVKSLVTVMKWSEYKK